MSKKPEQTVRYFLTDRNYVVSKIFKSGMQSKAHPELVGMPDFLAKRDSKILYVEVKVSENLNGVNFSVNLLKHIDSLLHSGHTVVLALCKTLDRGCTYGVEFYNMNVSINFEKIQYNEI